MRYWTPVVSFLFVHIVVICLHDKMVAKGLSKAFAFNLSPLPSEYTQKFTDWGSIVACDKKFKLLP